MRFVKLKLMVVVISVLVLSLAIPATQADTQVYVSWNPTYGGSNARANIGSTIAGSFYIRINAHSSRLLSGLAVTSATRSEANSCTPPP